MPARDWADFLQAHYRAHLLVVDLGTRGKGTRARRLVDLLGQLTESLQTTADYAMCCEEQEVKIAFESELDVETLGKLLMARVAERGGKDWASRSVCNLDARLKIVRRSNRRPSMAETTAAAFAAHRNPDRHVASASGLYGPQAPGS